MGKAVLDRGSEGGFQRCRKRPKTIPQGSGPKLHVQGRITCHNAQKQQCDIDGKMPENYAITPENNANESENDAILPDNDGIMPEPENVGITSKNYEITIETIQ